MLRICKEITFKQTNGYILGGLVKYAWARNEAFEYIDE